MPSARGTAGLVTYKGAHRQRGQHGQQKQMWRCCKSEENYRDQGKNDGITARLGEMSQMEKREKKEGKKEQEIQEK